MGKSALEKRISFNDILKLKPDLYSLFKKHDDLWERELKINGWGSMREPLESIIKDNGLIENMIDLPPFLRIGRLQLEKQHEKRKEYDTINSYLDTNSYPALISFRDAPAILLKSKKENSQLLDLFQGSLIRLISNLDPSVVKVTVVDIENFGSKFQILNSSIPNPTIISESRDLKDFVSELPEDLKRRNQTRGLAHKYLYEFNKKNKDSALPYHFILIGAFDKDIDDETKLSLKKIIANSNAVKAGIYIVLNFFSESAFDDFAKMDKSLPRLIEEDYNDYTKIELLDDNGIDTSESGKQSDFEIVSDLINTELVSKLAARCLNHLQKRAPEPVHFDLPNQENWESIRWKESAAAGIDLPIGKSLGNQINLKLGFSGSIHNALIGGAVGSGKTVLLHGIILQAMKNYSPNELRLSLLDYKDGTEFNIYKKIPHLHALSIGSGTKFGVDLLKSFQNELISRAKLFKEANVSNLEAYRKKTGSPLHRHLIVIDEFQVLMNAGQNEEAKNTLEDLIRRGRSYGFTFILSSQSLKDGGLTPATKNNLGLRICLRVSESDSSDFLSPINNLPTKFKDAGQAVYNNQEGAPEANLEFRCAYYKTSEISEFIDIICIDQNVVSHKPYIYDDSEELTAHELKAYSKTGSITIGLEEGIPPIPHFIEIHDNKSAVLFSGTGENKNVLHKYIIDQATDKNHRIVEFDAESVLAGGNEEFKSSPNTFDNTIVLINIKAKNSNNYDYRRALESLLLEEKVKYFIWGDFPNDVQSYKDRCDMIICLDQRSYSSLAYSRKNISSNTIAIVNQQHPDGVLVKIPK